MIVPSPTDKLPGFVEVADSLTFPQLLAFKHATEAAQAAAKEGDVIQYNAALLPGILACVARWNIANMPEHPTAENFPSTPVRAVSKLLAAVVAAVNTVIIGDEQVPPV